MNKVQEHSIYLKWKSLVTLYTSLPSFLTNIIDQYYYCYYYFYLPQIILTFFHELLLIYIERMVISASGYRLNINHVTISRMYD